MSMFSCILQNNTLPNYASDYWPTVEPYWPSRLLYIPNMTSIQKQDGDFYAGMLRPKFGKNAHQAYIWLSKLSARTLETVFDGLWEYGPLLTPSSGTRLRQRTTSAILKSCQI